MAFCNENDTEYLEKDMRFIKLLAKKYPTIDSACTEIINLQAILNLPKGTEHFLSDIHGEYEPLIHVLKNASGVIKRKIEDNFGTSLRAHEKKDLATLIYYPEQKLELVRKEESSLDDWYKITLYRLIKLCRNASSKYTRSKVRKALPKDFGYIIEELLHEQHEVANKQDYYEQIIDSIIDIGKANDFIIALCKLIQRLVVDRLHIIGDIFDRGPGADIILDTLMEYHSIDIQWGNHDILWMGAAAGSEACICNVLRIAARYANLDTIEEGYGINLLPLATFAIDFYKNDPCTGFAPKVTADTNYSKKEMDLVSKMHKAITILQFKMEAQIIKRRPHYEMDDRLLLHRINYEEGTIELNEKVYKLNDSHFPTIDPMSPYELMPEEKELIDRLRSSFLNSEKLQKHTKFLFAKGSMYLKYNANLLYHGCVPMDEDGNFTKIKIGNKEYGGKEYIDRLERLAREGYFYKNNPVIKQYGMDCMWYLWAGPHSPLFGKTKMATFERYFINDKEAHVEHKNPYYKFRDDIAVCNRILQEFGLDTESAHIINGHVPVKYKDGESPIKANGKVLDIDGGFSKAYQKETGIAGYTLIYNSYGLMLVSHEPFESTQKAIQEGKDILSSTILLEQSTVRKRVADTDSGAELKQQIEDLKLLVSAYRKGLIKEER